MTPSRNRGATVAAGVLLSGIAASLMATVLLSSTAWRGIALVLGLAATAGSAALLAAALLRLRRLEVEEEGLRESQRIARIGSWEHNVAAGTFFWSEEMFRIFNRDPAAGPPPLEERLAQVHPADRDRVSRVVEETLRTGRLEPFEYRIETEEGERMIHVEGVVPRRDAQGHATRVAGTCQDITERRLLENEARRLERRLEELRRLDSLGTLAGGIAHDFNNILMAILGNTQLALAKIPKGTPGRDNLEPILESSQRAKALVAQILDFSRNQSAPRDHADAANVVREAVRFLRGIVPPSVVLRTDVPNGPVPFVGSETQIFQVIVNLGTNAIDAVRSPGGDVEVALEEVPVEDAIRARHADLAPGPWIAIRVSDTGCGIAEDIRPRIFDPFYTTKPVGGGVGMGLAVVWGIVGEHGGAIEVDTAPDRGTSFRVILPRGAPAGQPPEPPRTPD